MNLQHQVVAVVATLVIMKCASGLSTSNTEETASFHGKLPVSNSASEYKMDNVFPDVDYPTAVLDSIPFYYKADDVLLNAFNEDVKSSFETIATNIKTKSNNTPDLNLIENPKAVIQQAPKELNEKEVSTTHNAVQNHTRDTITRQNNSLNSDSGETGIGKDKSAILENSSSSEESQERDTFETNSTSTRQPSSKTVQQNLANATVTSSSLSSDKISDYVKSSKNQYEHQIPVPIFLSQTEQSDLEDVLLDLVDKIISSNNSAENLNPVFGDFSSKATQAISTVEFILSKPPLASSIENLDGSAHHKSVQNDSKEVEEVQFMTPGYESDCASDKGLTENITSST